MSWGCVMSLGIFGDYEMPFDCVGVFGLRGMSLRLCEIFESDVMFNEVVCCLCVSLRIMIPFRLCGCLEVE